jgi:hypothetical protein
VCIYIYICVYIYMYIYMYTYYGLPTGVLNGKQKYGDLSLKKLCPLGVFSRFTCPDFDKLRNLDAPN